MIFWDFSLYVCAHLCPSILNINIFLASTFSLQGFNTKEQKLKNKKVQVLFLAHWNSLTATIFFAKFCFQSPKFICKPLLPGTL